MKQHDIHDCDRIDLLYIFTSFTLNLFLSEIKRQAANRATAETIAATGSVTRQDKTLSSKFVIIIICICMYQMIWIELAVLFT